MNSTALEDLCWAAIDFESAGTAPGETDCPVQIGIVRVEQLFSDAPQLFTSYIACQRPVPTTMAASIRRTTPVARAATQSVVSKNNS